MLRPGGTTANVVSGTSQFEGMNSKKFLAFEQGLDLHRSPTVTSGMGEVNAVVGENGADLGNVDMEVPDRIGFELALIARAVFTSCNLDIPWR